MDSEPRLPRDWRPWRRSARSSGRHRLSRGAARYLLARDLSLNVAGGTLGAMIPAVVAGAWANRLLAYGCIGTTPLQFGTLLLAALTLAVPCSALAAPPLYAVTRLFTARDLSRDRAYIAGATAGGFLIAVLLVTLADRYGPATLVRDAALAGAVATLAIVFLAVPVMPLLSTSRQRGSRRRAPTASTAQTEPRSGRRALVRGGFLNVVAGTLGTMVPATIAGAWAGRWLATGCARTSALDLVLLLIAALLITLPCTVYLVALPFLSIRERVTGAFRELHAPHFVAFTAVGLLVAMVITAAADRYAPPAVLTLALLGALATPFLLLVAAVGRGLNKLAGHS